MKITVNECYELDPDYQVQFLGNEVFPSPRYIKSPLLERTINKIHYKDVYVIEPHHYYYITFNEDCIVNPVFTFHLQENGILFSFDKKQTKLYIFNGANNVIYIQKNMKIGEVIENGWKFTGIENFSRYCRDYF